jgi:AcrR family transcriptional regulator
MENYFQLSSAKPMRADARRNRAHVLEVAGRLLAAQGASVSFDEIARQAGVGVGTVYRHIPTKEDLFRTVVLAGTRQLTDEAYALAKAEDAGDAFFRFVWRMAEQTAINKALCEAFEANSGSPCELEPEADREFMAALDGLLSRAQQGGDVRDDLDATDVRAIVVGSVMMDRMRGDIERPRRMVALVSSVLRPGQAPVPVPLPAVTERRRSRPSRNETSGRNETPGETPAPRCEMCGGPIRAAQTGRRARFCGASCRQRAHRQRHRAGSSSHTD